MSLQIFVESPNDRMTNEKYFIEQYVEHIKPGAQVNIIGADGKDNLKLLDNEMEKNTKSGGKNLVIFDCDTKEKDGGMEKRTADMESLKQERGVEFDYFLFPNNSDEGAFEDLLERIINKKHKCVLDCFHGYEMCIKGQDPEGKLYEMPTQKAKMYTYIETFKKSRSKKEKMKGGDWQFTKKKYWNLDDPYLNPLKEFLLKYL